jgi:hypothetical protein
VTAILLARCGTMLGAVDDEAAAVIARIGEGEIVSCEVRRPRNLAMHRKFFAMVRVVVDATGLWPNEECCLRDLKERVGLYSVELSPVSGEDRIVHGSISFAQMDQDAFTKFYETCLRELCDMAGGIEHDALRAAVLEALGA